VNFLAGKSVLATPLLMSPILYFWLIGEGEESAETILTTTKNIISIFPVPSVLLHTYIWWQCKKGCCYITADPETRASKNGICVTQQMCDSIVLFHNVFLSWSKYYKFSYAKEPHKNKFRFGVCMRFRSYRYVAAPIIGDRVSKNVVIIIMGQ
jgi:hypothetical protein